MSRFATLPQPTKGGRFANLRERMNAPLPGEAMVPSTDAKYAKRLPEFRPQVPASSAKATASVAPVAPIAPAKPNAPVKSAATIAAEATNARINAVMDSPMSNGKKKAASKLLHMTKASATEIITQLKSMEPDAIREQAEADALWKKATAKANTIAGFNDEPTISDNAVQAGWAKAVAKVNAMNGFSS
jgi:hypothetical protein